MTKPSNSALAPTLVLRALSENTAVLLTSALSIALSLVVFKVWDAPLDAFMFRAVNDLGRGSVIMNEPVKFVGWLGGDSLWLISVPAITLLRNRPRERNTMLLLAAGAATSILLISGLKPLFALPRPHQVLTNVHLVVDVPDTPTFPSGHASMAFVTALIVGLRHRRFLPLLLPLALGTSFAMAYVGAHFVSDVIAGAFLGIGIGSTIHVFGRNLAL